ncbi:MAG: HEAT repeat domain-containing protein [Tepidisphaerales bacterium]
MGVLYVYVVCTTPKSRSGVLPVPPSPPSLCPVCGHHAFNCITSGLWDGFDKLTGATLCGGYFYGTCQKCGARCAERDAGKTYVPDDEEWYREIDMCSRKQFTIDELIERLLSASPTARVKAAGGILGSFGVNASGASRAELTEPLSRLLAAVEVEREVRCAAARLLGWFGGRDAIPALLGVLSDAQVSSAVLAALDHLRLYITDSTAAVALRRFLDSRPDPVSENMARDILADLEADPSTR